MADTQVRRVPHKMAPATAKAIELLRAGKPGDVVTDEQAAAAMDMAIRSKDDRLKVQAYVRTASKSLEHDGIFWRRTQGAHAIVCLDDAGRCDYSGWHLQRVHRRAKRALRTATGVDVSKLDDLRKQAHAATLLMAEVTARASANTTRKKIALRNGSIDLPKLLADVLEK